MYRLHSLLFLLYTFICLPSAYANAQLNQQIDNDIVEFQSLAEQALSYREITLQVNKKFKQKSNNNIPLNGSDIETLNTGMLQHLALRKKLYTFVGYYEYLLDKKASNIDKATRLKGVMLSLSAALILYDNYLLSIEVFEKDTRLRRFLNSNHMGYNIKSSKLHEVTRQYNSIEKRNRALKAINFVESEWQNQTNEFKQQALTNYLYLLITQSPSYNHLLKFSPIFIFNQQKNYLTEISSDTLSNLGKEGMNLFSLLFGNSVGMVEVRKGRLNNDLTAHSKISSQIRAGDILLEKTPFRLTDKLIPGYWGHVAIWVGSEAELKQLGIWNHPVVEKYHAKIQSSQLIAEALRSGVELNSLKKFMNVDDLAVLRKNNLDDKARADAIIRTLRQIGKSYDFNFDIETNDKIVCSELIYVSFTDTEWPTKATLGRHTISPTNIAEKAGNELPFTVVSLFLNGKQVNDEINSRFTKLNRLN